MKKWITLLFILFLALALGSCKTTIKPNKGGNAESIGQLGSAQVTQVEDAKKQATLDYDEEGVEIPFNDGDTLEVVVSQEASGKKIKEISFLPKNQGTAKVFSVTSKADTGFSYKNTLGEFKLVLKEFRLIMWVGVAFLAGGGIFAGVFRDFKSGIILGSIGALILGGYAILPQIYSHWILVLCIGGVVVPVIWYFTFKKRTRVAKASIRAFEKLKEEDPALAERNSLYFKKDLNESDILEAKKIKALDKKL